MGPEKIAICALAISFFTFVVVIINLVYTAKTHKNNRGLQFQQRRDHLSQKISALNDSNNEARLISAKYELVAVKKVGLSLRGEQAERNTALIASIKEQRAGLEAGIKLWDVQIRKLHFIYSHLALIADAPKVERMITLVQVALDDVNNLYSGYSSALHTLETTNELVKTNLADTEEKIRQINLNFERAREKLNVTEA
jgi:hypothetical protein